MRRTGLACAVLSALVLMSAAGAGAAPFLYTTDHNGNSVTVIDAANNSVVATVPVGTNPFGVSVTPDGALIYVTNSSSNSVSVIFAGSNRVVATVPVGLGPTGVEVTPDGAHAYVANGGDNTVSVIDTVSNSVTGLPIPVGALPTGVAVTPDGASVYVTNEVSGSVSVISTATNTVIATVTVGSFPLGAAATLDGASVYVANLGDGTVSVISTATNTVTATVQVGTFPFGVAANPLDGKRVYVTNFQDNTVSVIDTTTTPPTVIATVPVGANPVSATPTPTGDRVYIANSCQFTLTCGSFSVILAANNTVIATVPVRGSPYNFGETMRRFQPGVIPFTFFTAEAELHVQHGTFEVNGKFTVPPGGTTGGTACSGIDPIKFGASITVGPFSTTIPPGSFRWTGDQDCNNAWVFFGTVSGGTALKVTIKPQNHLKFQLHIEATGANLKGATNPVVVRLRIGTYEGTAVDPNGVKK